MATGRFYSAEELRGLTKLQLREVLKGCGLEFDNAEDHETIIARIVKAQEKQDASGGQPGKSKGNGGQQRPAGNVRITSGASSSTFQVAGQTVTKVRADLEPTINIDPGAKARVNGEEVEGNYVLKDGDRLEFVKQSGTKAFIHNR